MFSGQETEPATDSSAQSQRLPSQTCIPNKPQGSSLPHCENDKLLRVTS